MDLAEYMHRCLFCNRHPDKCNIIVGIPPELVCDKCVEAASKLVEKIREEYAQAQVKAVMKPKEIFKQLDRYVIGQNGAKKMLSVAVYNHFLRLSSPTLKYQKANVLMCGPTGSGKTYILDTLARIVGVPFITADITTCTASGYVGSDVQDILIKLCVECDFDLNQAERGIIYIDEIDKVAASEGRGKDVNGKSVQQALLKIMEGYVTTLEPDLKTPIKGFNHAVQLDTSNILFVCGGAFVGLDEIVAERLAKADEGSQGTIGFGSSQESRSESLKGVLRHVIPEDYQMFGIIPEFVGRLPNLVSLEELTKTNLIDIMTQPINNLYSQYRQLLGLSDIDLVIRKSAFEAIADIALERGTGARGLKSVIEKVLGKIMFECESGKKVITKEQVMRTAK